MNTLDMNVTEIWQNEIFRFIDLKDYSILSITNKYFSQVIQSSKYYINIRDCYIYGKDKGKNIKISCTYGNDAYVSDNRLYILYGIVELGYMQYLGAFNQQREILHIVDKITKIDVLNHIDNLYDQCIYHNIYWSFYYMDCIGSEYVAYYIYSTYVDMRNECHLLAMIDQKRNIDMLYQVLDEFTAVKHYLSSDHTSIENIVNIHGDEIIDNLNNRYNMELKLDEYQNYI